MKYRVHVYATVRVPVDIAWHEATSVQHAVELATNQVSEEMNRSRIPPNAEYADEITDCLVDIIDGEDDAADRVVSVLIDEDDDIIMVDVVNREWAASNHHIVGLLEAQLVPN